VPAHIPGQVGTLLRPSPGGPLETVHTHTPAAAAPVTLRESILESARRPGEGTVARFGLPVD